MSLKHSLKGLLVDDIVCINLKHRKERRTQFKRESRKKGFPVSFVDGIVNKTDGQKGKWDAHRKVWLNAIRNSKNVKYRGSKTKDHRYITLIFEDDAKVLMPKLALPSPPKEWKMLYLGGNIQRVITDEATDTSAHWKRACALMCHAYIIDQITAKELLQQSDAYFKMCKEENKSVMHIDEWLCSEYHPNNNCYISIPDRVIQRDGFSDSRCEFITFNQQLTARVGCVGGVRGIGDNADIDVDAIDLKESQMTELDRTPMEIVTSKDGDQEFTNCVLKLPKIETDELPNVTLITPTHNNRSGFYFVIRNFYKLQYPKEKITWIIADDSEEGKEVRDLIPGNDQRIKYISCKMGKNSFLPISKKINLCMNYVTSSKEVIVHFFDDQYYPEMSVLSRVKVLMAANTTNPEKMCTGCTDFGVFDIVNNKSYQKYYPDANNNRTIMYGPSLCYFKSWWDMRKFDENRYVMETFYFTKGRLHQTIQMPYSFVLTTLVSNDPDFTEADRYGRKGNSKKNSEDTFAKYDKNAQLDNFYDGWDKETQNFILLMKETLDEE